jgi:hypothetical protein
MISSIHIEGYRGFDSFEMSGLGRVNLLVGTNKEDLSPGSDSSVGVPGRSRGAV